ncbi:MAG: carboxymuconolactone decarboxylase family protein [Candidatus Binatia bacterium]
MPRIPLIETKDSIAPEHQPIYQAIVESRGAVRGSFPALLHVPAIADRTARLGGYIRFESKLDPRIKGLAVLVATRELECRHEWSAQVRNAEKNGISRATVEAVHRRKPASEFSQEDGAVVRYVQELLREHRVSEPAFQSLHSRLGVQALVELTATIGYYAMGSCTMNAFELGSDHQPEGLAI